MNKNIAIIEGLLFIVGEDGLSSLELASILDVDVFMIKDLINTLKDKYDNDCSSGLTINYLGEKYKLTTKPNYNDYYKKIVDEVDNNILSQAALETLAILAYNGPITRANVDEIRGISSSQMIRKLISRGLVKIVGKASLPGRPNLYQVTENFLDSFGLETLDDLPKIDFTIQEEEELELFKSKYVEKN